MTAIIWTNTPPHPLRRFFARLLDNALYGGPLLFVFISALTTINADTSAFAGNYNSPAGLENIVFTNILTASLVLLPNAVVIGFTGSSIGKFIFGVQVRNEDGSRLGFKKSLRREVMVLTHGRGAGIPILSLFALWKSYEELRYTGNTRWDKNLDCAITYRPNGKEQTLLIIATVVVCMAMYMGWMVLSNGIDWP